MTPNTNPSPEDRLAIDGGQPARRRPDPPMYPGGNLIGDEEEQAVLEVLRSKRLFRYYGPQPGPSRVAQLEAAFAAHMGAQKAIAVSSGTAAVSSGTAALMCGLAGIGVGPGDEVIVPAYTWIASASAVVMMGGIPIVAEVDDTLTLNPADVERKVTPRTKAIMPVHMRGAPARNSRFTSRNSSLSTSLLCTMSSATRLSAASTRRIPTKVSCPRRGASPRCASPVARVFVTTAAPKRAPTCRSSTTR